MSGDAAADEIRRSGVIPPCAAPAVTGVMIVERARVDWS
jgi:hypothetical protein